MSQNKPITSSEQLIQKAQTIASEGRRKRIAVAAAQDAAVLVAVADAVTDGFISAVLVGDKSAIDKITHTEQINLGSIDIIDEPDITKAAHTAVGLAASGEADAIMKGFLPTSSLLKVLLDKQYNLRGKNTLSHCAVLDIPGYHKLLNMTDGGMVVKPDQEQKFQILENAVLVGRALGLSPIKIAVSGPYAELLDDLPYLKEDQEMLLPQARLELQDILIEAPIPFDLAISKEAADLQSYDNEIAGDADVFLVNSIEECNIIAKSMIQFIEAVFAGVIVGAKVPVSLVSRTDSVKNKMTSLALAAIVADYYQQYHICDKGEKS